MLSSPNSTCQWTCINNSVSFDNDTVPYTSAMCGGNSFGEYYFVLTETNGNCVGTDTVIINYQPLYPDAGSDTTICDTVYQMNAEQTYPGYWWGINPGIYISNNNDPNAIIGYNPDTITWPQNGVFTTLFYWTISSEGCSYTDSVRITFSQCLDNVNTLNKSKITRIYPNPAHNNIHIEIEGSQYADKVEILNIDGKLVKQLTINNNLLDISDLQNGVYFIKFGNSIQKFIKQ